MHSLKLLLLVAALAVHNASALAVNVTQSTFSGTATTESCSPTTCSASEECVLKQVECIRAPCPAIPTCVAKTAPTESSATQVASVCSRGVCADGEDCVAKQVQCFAAPCPPIATCVPQSTTASCSKKCGRNQRCFFFNSKQYCADTCPTSRCKKNERCELQRVQCLVAPCPRVATCKPL